MTEQNNSFLDSDMAAEAQLDASQLMIAVMHLVTNDHVAYVLGELLIISIAVIHAVEDESLRKKLEQEYMRAYRFWSARSGHVTPEEVKKSSTLTADSKCVDTIMGYLLRTRVFGADR